MAKFSFQKNVVEFVNKLFGADIQVQENGEDKDDPTLFNEIKEIGTSHMDGIQAQLSDLRLKADAHDALQLQVEELTKEVNTHKESSDANTLKIAQMQKDFDKKMNDLREELHAELVKENPTLNFNGLKVLNEDDVNKRTKEMVVDAWKDDNKPKVSVG